VFWHPVCKVLSRSAQQPAITGFIKANSDGLKVKGEAAA